MKRTPLRKVSLKKKVKKPKKLTKLKKQSKQPISKIQRQLWEECKRIIRSRYPNKCFTCDRQNLEGSNMHTAHFIPKASCGAYLKYDLRNLRICCYHCNINLGGNGSMFYRNLVSTEGQSYVDKLFSDKNITIKAYDYYLKLLDEYKRTEK